MIPIVQFLGAYQDKGKQGWEMQKKFFYKHQSNEMSYQKSCIGLP